MKIFYSKFKVDVKYRDKHIQFVRDESIFNYSNSKEAKFHLKYQQFNSVDILWSFSQQLFSEARYVSIKYLLLRKSFQNKSK